MKTIALQDNLSKVKAVEDLCQQLLRFPDDVQQAAAAELLKQRNLRRRRVSQSEESDGSKLRARKKSPDVAETEVKGRREQRTANPEGEAERQCCIDFRV